VQVRPSVVAVLLLTAVAAAQVAPRPYHPRYEGDPARSMSEAVALGYIKTVQSAQSDYRKRNGRYAGSLAALVNYGSFTRRMARADRRDYTVAFRGGAGGYSVQLIPKVFEATRRSFYSDQGGTMRVAEDSPATADSPILKPDTAD
jgi:hypothetical protein